MAGYLFRLDDITDTINPDAFDRCFDLLMRHGVKPILGVIPDNRDVTLNRFPARAGFWKKLAEAHGQGQVTIALHGLHHVYHENSRSLLFPYGIGPLSEFAGLPFEVQSQKIAAGIRILERRNLKPTVWMAPNHSFDNISLAALNKNGIFAVTDGIGLFRFRRHGLVFMPVLSGRPRRVPCGFTTICLHTETMAEADFASLEAFLAKKPRCLSFEEALAIRTPFIIGPLVNVLVRAAFFFIKQLKFLWRKRNPS